MSAETDDWVRRYVALYGNEALPPEGLRRLEEALGFQLPRDFHAVSTAYSGGQLGGLEIFSFGPTGPGPTLSSRTLELRAASLLGPLDVVLAEPPESLVVWQSAPTDRRVLRLSAIDVSRVLVDGQASLADVDEWSSFSAFVESLLRQDEDEGLDE